MRIDVFHIARVIRFGVKNIWLHKLRSFLTVLGIVFGVASVIAMLAIGEGASYEARKKIEELGSNNVIIRSVQPPSDGRQQQVSFMAVYGITPSDLRKLGTIPSVERIVPTWELSQDVWRLGRHAAGRIVGTVPEYADTLNLNVSEGRFFGPVDAERNALYAVIGSSLKTALFPTEPAIGKSVKVKSSYFTVIGVAAEKSAGGAGGAFAAEDINFDVYIPLTTSRSVFGEYNVKRTGGRMDRSWVRYHRVVVKVADTSKIIGVSALINDVLSGTHKNPDYEILVPLELLKQAEHTQRIFSIVLGSIAAISLLVGGIGIMNIMLATVTERTREIGIRRALGARRRDIINQFLAEAVILSTAGGFIGVVLGVVIPHFVTKFAGMATVVTLWSILLSFGISVAVGVSFGIYPARKAAFLDPIQALRYE